MAAGAVLAVGVVGAFGPYVRSRITADGARRGFVVSVGRIRPEWLGLELDDVSVVPEGTSGVHAHVGRVNIALSPGLAIERVTASGVVADLEGDAVFELAAWRERHAPKGESGGSKTPVVFEQVAVDWKHANGDPDASFQAAGFSVKREGNKIHVAGESAVLTRKQTSVTLGASTAEIEDGKLRDAHVDAARVAFQIEARATASLPVNEPIIVQTKPKKGAPPEPFRPFVELPDLHVLRAMIQNVATRAAERAPDGLHVTLDALTMEITRDQEKLELGPGKVTAAHEANELTFDFSAGTGQTPLVLHASIPIEAGDTVVALAGGPVTLSMLGVREGAFGFVDPARASLRGQARISLDDAATALMFDADLAASALSIKNAKLADEIVRGLDVRVAARGVLDDRGAIRLDAAEGQLGALHVRTHGTIEQTTDHMAASLSLSLPVAGCQSLLESVPAALLPHLATAQFRGTLGANGFLAFDTRKIDDLVLRYDIDDECRVTAVAEGLKKDHFDGTFTYGIVDKDGKPSERQSGPGSDEWAPLDTISPMMQVAVLTTEDGAFFHHHGFNTWAIRSSIVANLKAGRFIRGASTITMQLAKNLFLSRNKTLSRKLEEVILTDYLERSFHKDDMMELYLNIIEFGPDIYGVHAAAMHYFGRRPAELNLAESLFLATLLPRPREYHKMYETGEPTQSWMNNIHQLMEVAFKNGRISEKELEEAKTQPIVFHREDAPLPPPRAAISASHFTGDDTDKWETN